MKINVILAGIAMSLLLLALPAAASDYTLGVFGNANEDEVINMQDVTYTELIILEYRDKTELSDAKYDDRINMQDVTQIELIILGREKELTILDLADRTVTINKPVEKVVPLFNFEEYLAVEGGEDPFIKIVGWTRAYWEGRRQWIWEKYTEAFPAINEITDVGYIHKGTFSAEKTISLEPDIVIMSKNDYESARDDISRLEQAGIPAICVDYHIQTIEAHTKSTLMLGYVLGKEERAQDLVDFYTEHVDEVYTRIEGIDKPEPEVYIECGYKGTSEYGNTYGNFMWGALIEDCGGMNIAEGVIEKSAQINPEYLLDANPDVIIITGSYWPATSDSMRLGYYADPDESRELLDAFTDRPGWDTLDAVNNNKVYSIHHGLSRHIHDFVAVQYFAKCFYPEEFEDLDPEEDLKEFHELFMPVEYSGVWMLSIVE